MTEDTYIKDYLDKSFPDFDYSIYAEDDSILIMSLFTDYIIKNSQNKKILKKIAHFINNILVDTPTTYESILDEVAITLYCEESYDILRPLLSSETGLYFDENIELWTQDNKEE